MIELSILEDGDYEVRYYVVSSNDGHPIQGAFMFQVGDEVFLNEEIAPIKDYVGKAIRVRTDDEYSVGTLVRVENGEIHLLMNQKNKKQVNVDDICYLEVLNLK